MRHPATDPTKAVAKIGAIVALLALVATSALAATHSSKPTSAPPNATIRAVSDNLSISNSHSGGAVFSANNIAPGDQTVGTVTIGNSGNIPGDFTLAPSDLSDTPGPNGGALSGALDLTVEDLTANSVVYSGKLNSFGQHALGTWQPGQSRNYRFTATLPDTGIPASPTAGDNVFKGSSTSLALNWAASGEGNIEPPPPPPPPPSLKLNLAGKTQKLRSKKLSWTVSCSRDCTVKVSGQFAKRKGKKGKLTKMFAAKIKPVSLKGGQTKKMQIKISKKQAKKIKKALKKRYGVALSLKATAGTASGATTSSTALIPIKP